MTTTDEARAALRGSIIGGFHDELIADFEAAVRAEEIEHGAEIDAQARESAYSHAKRRGVSDPSEARPMSANVDAALAPLLDSWSLKEPTPKLLALIAAIRAEGLDVAVLAATLREHDGPQRESIAPFPAARYYREWAERLAAIYERRLR